MACSNELSESDINEIESEAYAQAQELVDAFLTSDSAVQQFAESYAKDVIAYAQAELQIARLSGSFTQSDLEAIKDRLDQFAEQKATELREYERREALAQQAAHEKAEWEQTRYKETEPDFRNSDWVDPNPGFETNTGRWQNDQVPDFNPNTDADTIPGFHSGFYEKPNGFGIIMKDENEPNRSTHLHYHKDGITISSMNSETGTVDRFNFTTGRDTTNEGEGTEWPEE